ncbi:MAG: adenylate/guanylate cyclase domain-containing protein [Thermodesulfobacteriota bacterium]
MSRVDCISNRNLRIAALYVANRVGHSEGLFEGLPYPTDRFSSPDEYFLNEDEWTTHENFIETLRRAKSMTGEDYFFFSCGASAASLQSWGRFQHFVGLFTGPNDGFKRLPFFNRNFTDTKDIEVVLPPSYVRTLGKIRTILKIQHHEDIDVHKDYVGEPYSRGIISSIPTLWGLKPATIRQPLNPYDPEILFSREPEFMPFGLDVRMEGDQLTLRRPEYAARRPVGRRILLEPEPVDGRGLYLGRYRYPADSGTGDGQDGREAILITETVRAESRILLKAGEIFRAPYFILDVTFDPFSLVDRVRRIFRSARDPEESGKGLIDTINRLRDTVEARNRAYHELEKSNRELVEAKKKVDEHAATLEQKVEERTTELQRAREELLVFNRNLKSQVNAQVEELSRYRELRRYLSPRLTERILSSGETLGSEPQRKLMTVLFSDIRNFSSFTENLEPEEIFHLLDRYLSEMTLIIHEHEGTLNKIIGDGLLAFFGDPIPMEDHAERAVRTAVEMQRKVAELKDEWLRFGQELGIGIGINTGYMTVGNIGSDQHKDYTVIGNQVNVAARLESLAKPGQILISQRTYARARGAVEAEKVGDIRVKGIYYPVMTYSVKAFPAPSP